MKKILPIFNGVLLLGLFAGADSAFAQGTQFTYQGRLNNNGSPANGSYDLVFGVFGSSNGVGQVGNTVTNLNTGVSNGLFTVTLDFGPGIFTGANLWLGIGVRTNGGANYAALSPLQALTPTPYAIFAGAASNLVGTVSAAQVSGPLPAAQLTGTDSNPVTFNNGGNTFDGTFYGNFFGASFIGGNFTGAFIGNGSGLAGVNAANSATLNGLSSSNFWQTTGNSNTAPGVNFLGTTDTSALELRVGARRALRIEPDPAGIAAPNLIGGYPSNAVVQPNSAGDTIAGGGYSGGYNMVLSNTSGAFIGGGSGNWVGPSVFDSVIAAGKYNSVQSSEAGISSGYGNWIQANSDNSVIGGGDYNTIENGAYGSVIGGGYNNLIHTNADHGTIAGGWQNVIQPYAWESAISGGELNVIGTNAQWSDIGGGEYNNIASTMSVIGGGYGNSITNSYSVIVGGIGNVAGGFLSTVGGGQGNTASANNSTTLGGLFNTNTGVLAFLGAGAGNTIQPGSYGAFLGGGQNNTNGSVLAFLGGGNNNSIQAFAGQSFIGGGSQNLIQTNASSTFIGGGGNNTVQSNAYNSAIGGGSVNTIMTNAPYSAIGGGYGNSIFPNAAAGTIAGGFENVVAGAGAFIGGGGVMAASNGIVTSYYGNYAPGLSSVVPGGAGNAAFGAYSFAAGHLANAFYDGSFVWADLQTNSFFCTGSNQFAVRASGGVILATSGAGLTVDGQTVLAGSIVGGQYNFPNTVNFTSAGNTFDGNGSGLVNVNAAKLNGLSAGNFWQTGGNTGTTAGVNFLGTTDDQPLELRVNAGRALRLEPNLSGAPNVIGGAGVNFVAPGTVGATIAGGGALNYSGFSYTNSAAGNFGFIGGGLQNTVLAGSTGGVIGGGQLNTSGGQFSTVPGGNANAALGNDSFAAGNRAKANHTGAFVWADSQNADFASTTNDQFSVRAQGGVRLNPGTNNIEIASGGIKVTGAGIGTSTTAFIQTTTVANLSGDLTYINNSLCNGDPNAMLIVTHCFNPGGSGIASFNNHPIGVYYNGSQWGIYNDDGAIMATNVAFNVLVIKR